MTVGFGISKSMRVLHAPIAGILLCVLAPAASAQQPGLSLGPEFSFDRSGGLQIEAAPWRRKMLFGGLSDQGFNPARAGLAEQGLHATPSVLRALPAAPRLGPVEPGGATQTGAFVGYRFDHVLISSSIRQDFGGPGFGGTRVDVGASYGFNVTPRHLITLSGGYTLGPTAGGAQYATAFGNDALYRWGYRTGEPGAGLRLSWLYSFDRNLYFSTTLGYDRADSVEGQQGYDRSAASFGTIFGYRW